ncbi:MAG: helix-turn-helix domain-containing protein [Oscillospiraceae bacterium]|jgi:transcriptional regulator with XRE-family HTH domain
MTAGSKIEALRKKLGLSKEELAERAETTPERIGEWIDGEIPTDDEFKKLSQVFGISEKDLRDPQLELAVEDGMPSPLKRFIGRKCRILIDEMYPDPDITPSRSVVLEEVSPKFLKVSFKAQGKQTTKLVDLDAVRAIRTI